MQSCAYCRALSSIATFRHTPRLSSKGTVGGGNTSWIRVFRPEPYCTDPYRSVEMSQKMHALSCKHSRTSERDALNESTFAL